MVFPQALPFSRSAWLSGALAGLITALGAVSSISGAARAADFANVDDARIIENAKTGKEWLSNGLDYGVNRFSPLDQITTANVGKLGLAWSYRLSSTRGVEATPVVVDGVMYSPRRGASSTPSTPRQAKTSGLSIPSPRAVKDTSCVATS